VVSVSQEYLRRFPPLANVSDDALAEVERAGEIRTYEPGTVILQEDGTPATHLSIVRTGSVELVHDDDIIDVLEPGEAFGHPSLLTGLAPAFDVRAREKTTCLVLPADHASELLAGPAGVRFVARSLRDRMVRTGTLIIESASQDPLEFNDIPQVERVHSLLYHEVFDTLGGEESDSRSPGRR